MCFLKAVCETGVCLYKIYMDVCRQKQNFSVEIFFKKILRVQNLQEPSLSGGRISDWNSCALSLNSLVVDLHLVVKQVAVNLINFVLFVFHFMAIFKRFFSVIFYKNFGFVCQDHAIERDILLYSGL